MKRKQLKLLSTCLSMSMLLTTIPVSADFEISNITNGNSDEYVEYQSSDNEDFSTETSVYALIGSNYKVTIPKVIILSGIEKKANYYVDVTGDIAGVEKVNVVPDESVELFSTNKASQIASITQDRTSWGYEDLGTKANGLVQADTLTSGKWSGTFNFNIKLESEEEPVALAAGLYDENDNLIKSWDELVALGLNIEKKYTYSNYKTAGSGSGYDVFTNNNLSSKLVLPNSVTSIGEYTFCNCVNLTSITIPDSVTSIGNFAFDNCSGLTSIIIPNSVTSIGAYAFRNCTGLTSVTIPNSVTSISPQTFTRCTNLTSVIIQNGVASIGDNAFSNCSKLTSVTIPNSVTSIADTAFDNTPWLAAKQAENPLVIVNNILIDGKKCSGSITIPNSVTSIGTYAFRNCTGLTSVTIPNSVKNIGTYAFYNCTNLTSITIPNSVTSIGGSAFNGCSKLTSVTYRDVTYTDKTTLNNKVKSDGVTTGNVWP